MLDLPLPISKNAYSKQLKVIRTRALVKVGESLKCANEEVCQHYDGPSPDPSNPSDVLISCDGTWQKRGFSSLFGVVFVVSFETGKILDFTVKSKYCAGCKYWEKQDKTSESYKKWKESHSDNCEANFSGSAPVMESEDALYLFRSSLSHNLRYRYYFNSWW